MDLLAALAANLTIGVVSGIASGFLVAKLLTVREQRRQVWKVSADIIPEWTPVPGNGTTRSLTGVRLSIVNHSDWPVRNVMILSVSEVGMQTVSRLGPGDRRSWGLPSESSLIRGLDEAPVTIQLTDVRRRTWRWTPASGELEPISPKIPLHSHVVQWLDRRSPVFRKAVSSCGCISRG